LSEATKHAEQALVLDSTNDLSLISMAFVCTY
jgi:hypothetical protein